MAHDEAPGGRDLKQGVFLSEVPDGGMLAGQVDGQAALLARRGDEVFAIGGTCTHYSGPLAEGLVVEDTVRCPWHHACFSLRTGEALLAPALDPVPCWNVEREGDRVRVTTRRPAPAPAPVRGAPESIVVVGAGAAGAAAAERLRRRGYTGPVTLIGAEPTAPVDRPNLSKDYLAGSAPEEWVFLRGPEFYQEHQIDLLTGVSVTALDTSARRVTLSDDRSLPYGALLLATGAEPVRLPLPGADLPHVYTLRTLADSKAIIAAAEKAKRAVVIGASFIGLEVAASLRAREVEVDVVAPEERPLERVMGREIGDFVRAVHEEHGVRFHLGTTPVGIDAGSVTLKSGERLAADLVVMGVGVRPRTQLAEAAGLAVEKGIRVNEFLETSSTGIWAAGDVARYPDPRTGKATRIEHWVLAERQGQVAAENMLGGSRRFDLAPFFWSKHYDVTLNYVGHAEEWDQIEIEGRIPDRDCALRYWKDGRVLAVLTIGRDVESLRAEARVEREGRGT